MTHELLKTKLQPPVIPDQHLLRNRLCSKLDAALSGRLTLLSAPAGSGKSSLLSAWQSESNSSIAWLTLDEADNDFTHFVRYLVTAMQSVVPDVCEVIPVMLQAQPHPPVEALMTIVINELTELDDRLIVVLDDYHLIANESIHHSIQFLLDHMPPQLHLIISTRVDPPLTLSRLRAGRQMIEIRESDLRFSPEEIAEFLQLMLNIEVDTQHLTMLSQRTEGWVAGVQLAALSMLQSENIPSFIERFSGSHEYVVDYLTDEVLWGRPVEQVDFLLQTSILKQMRGDLCDSLTGRQDGSHELEALRKANLFVIPIDNEREWYRYHGLFTDVLRQRLDRSHRFDVDELHLRAGRWYRQQQIVIEAVSHLISAGAFEEASELLVQAVSSGPILATLAGPTIKRWIEALPERLIQAHPRILLTEARLAVLKGDITEGNRLLDEIESTFAGNGSEQAREIIHVLTADRTSNAILRGQVLQALEWVEHALSTIEETDVIGRMRLSGIKGTSAFQAGKTRLAASAYQQAVADARLLNMPVITASLMVGLAETQIISGQLHQAARTSAEAISLATVNGKMTPAAGPIGLVRAKVLYEESQLEDANKQLEEAIRILRKNGPVHSLAVAYAWLGRIKQALLDVPAANAAMQQALALSPGQHGYLSTLLPAFQTRLWLAQGDHSRASIWVEDYQTHEETEYAREFEDLTLARVLIVNDMFDEALSMLDTLYSNAQQEERIASLIEITILQCLVLQEQNAHLQAVETLDEAISKAAPAGYRQHFLNEGESLAPVLMNLPESSFASELLLSLDLRDESQSRDAIGDSTDFTERESDVLRFLDTDLTYSEIADHLYVAPSTIRSHVKSIYSKLDVHSRYEAIIKAKSLGIL